MPKREEKSFSPPPPRTNKDELLAAKLQTAIEFSLRRRQEGRMKSLLQVLIRLHRLRFFPDDAHREVSSE